MIHDLDDTLKILIEQTLPADLAEQVSISFDTPDDQFPHTGLSLPAIDMFLYDVRENRDLRSNEWLLDRRDDGSASKQRPPVRVDCSYLVTAWPSESAPSPARDEHYILSAVMKVLLSFPTIPAEVLQGSLEEQEPPLPAISLQPGRLQSLGEFWQALGGKPKAALNYTVTMGVQPATALEVPLVKEKVIRMRLGVTGEETS